MKKVIGITGPLGSGKTESAGILVKKGFYRLSLSDEVRKEADKQSRPHDRNVLQDIGDELRLTFGNSVLAQRVTQAMDALEAKGVSLFVIEGIKNPDEIAFLRRKYGMKTIGINANSEIRFKRILERQSESDAALSAQQIKTAMRRDMGMGKESHGNNIQGCLEIVDAVIINDRSRKELENNLEQTLSRFGLEGNHTPKEQD
jgi:dephospho-CoA kinase